MIVYQIFSYFVGSVGIILNATLLYLSISKTPFGIKTYSILIINLAITDLIASFCTIFVESRIIKIGHTSVVVNYGLCVNAGIQWCFYGYVLTLHLFLHSQFLLLYSFCFRLYSLKYGTLSKRNVIITLVIIYIPSVIQFISLSFSIGDTHILYGLLLEAFPGYQSTISSQMVTGIVNLEDILPSLGAAIMSFCPLIIYISVIIIRRKIIAKLYENATHLRRETKLMHQQLLKVLTFQAFLPVILLIGLILYTVEEARLYSHPFIECAVIAIFELLPVLSPIIYLYYVTPYRRAIMKLCGFKTTEHSTVSETTITFTNTYKSTITNVTQF